MDLKFSVKRHRLSVTQGETEVLVNGNAIARFGDSIEFNGKYGDIIDGYGSLHDDIYFVAAALRMYPERILDVLKNSA